MKISFCTNCRNRILDLQATLPSNLEKLLDDEELIVLDYNGQDGARQWVLKIFERELGAGRLRLYSERSAPRFFMAHAKNVCHLLGRGEILVNLDADNYLDPKYLHDLREWCKRSEPKAMLYPFSGSGGFKGRTAVHRDVFRRLGGYDEQMRFGYGYEEIDLFKRILAMKHKVQYVRIDPGSCIPTEPEQKAAGQLIPGMGVTVSNQKHRALCEHNLKHGRFVANAKSVWGFARLWDYKERRLNVFCDNTVYVGGLLQVSTQDLLA